jgi:hypothetical protein
VYFIKKSKYLYSIAILGTQFLSGTKVAQSKVASYISLLKTSLSGAGS